MPHSCEPWTPFDSSANFATSSVRFSQARKKIKIYISDAGKTFTDFYLRSAVLSIILSTPQNQVVKEPKKSIQLNCQVLLAAFLASLDTISRGSIHQILQVLIIAFLAKSPLELCARTERRGEEREKWSGGRKASQICLRLAILSIHCHLVGKVQSIKKVLTVN